MAGTIAVTNLCHWHAGALDFRKLVKEDAYDVLLSSLCRSLSLLLSRLFIIQDLLCRRNAQHSAHSLCPASVGAAAQPMSPQLPRHQPATRLHNTIQHNNTFVTSFIYYIAIFFFTALLLPLHYYTIYLKIIFVTLQTQFECDRECFGDTWRIVSEILKW